MWDQHDEPILHIPTRDGLYYTALALSFCNHDSDEYASWSRDAFDWKTSAALERPVLASHSSGPCLQIFADISDAPLGHFKSTALEWDLGPSSHPSLPPWTFWLIPIFKYACGSWEMSLQMRCDPLKSHIYNLVVVVHFRKKASWTNS